MLKYISFPIVKCSHYRAALNNITNIPTLGAMESTVLHQFRGTTGRDFRNYE